MQSLFVRFFTCFADLLRREKHSIYRHRLLGWNLFFISFERFLQVIALFYCLGVLTKNMSIEDYGKFNYALSLGGIFMTLSLFAGAELILPKLSRYRHARGDILTTGFYLRLCYALLSLLAVYLYQLYAGMSFDLFWICLGFCFANVIVEVPSILGCWLILQQKNTWFSSARLLGLVAKLLTFFYLTKINQSHTAQNIKSLSYDVFVWPYIAEGVISVIAIVGAFLICKKKAEHQQYAHHPHHSLHPHKKIKIWGKFKINIAKRLMRDGFMIGLALTAFFVLQRIDRLLLEQNSDFKTLGIYGNAMMLNDAWLNIGLNICSLLAPALIYNININTPNGLTHLQKMIKRCAIYLIAYSVIGILLTYFFSKKLIIWQFGSAYQQSVAVLQIAVCLAPLLLINQMYTFCWLHLKKYHIQLLAWVLPCVLMYVFNHWAILQISPNPITQMLFAWFMSYLGMWALQHGVLRRVTKKYS